MFHLAPIRIGSLVLSLLLFTDCSPKPAPTGKHRGAGAGRQAVVSGMRQVERVIDGDTMVLNGGTRVRLSYVNAPESKEELGPESTQFTRQLVQRKLVRVEGNKRDSYGRLVADVVVDGRSLARAIIEAGMGHLFVIPPFERDKVRPLLKAQTEAREARRGIWDSARYQGDFHITSFHANAPGNDNFNLNGEYLRITNIAVRARSMKGYRLFNSKGEYYEFPDVVVPAGHTIMIFSGHGQDQLDPIRQIKLYWKRKNGAWSNRGDTATLRDPEQKDVDQVVHSRENGKH